MGNGKEETSESGITDRLEDFDLGFLPKDLKAQCRSLIESYHEVHGFACLPDILWKFHLGPFIEKHCELRQILRQASTSRNARKSNECFVRIATAILALEILARRFAGWRAFDPQAAELAHAILERNGLGRHMPLMEFYLYPPKYLSSAAIGAFAPPAGRQAREAGSCGKSGAELSAKEEVLNYASTIRQTRMAKRLTSLSNDLPEAS